MKELPHKICVIFCSFLNLVDRGVLFTMILAGVEYGNVSAQAQLSLILISLNFTINSFHNLNRLPKTN